jgi:pimeloyl-ACP methyl ester carboxylesterase
VDRAPIGDIELEYAESGEGTPVVLIHAGVCADFFRPLAEQRALTTRHRVIAYHRAGYAGSSPAPDADTLADQAAHCRALMQHLGIEAAHIVGHSSSASISLQLALDAPEAVASLALLDPARPALPTPAHARMVESIAQPALERYGGGDKAGALDVWMRGVCGPDYQTALERALPDAFEQAVADADTFFGQELPAVFRWSFGADEAARVTQPALVVAGERSIPVFHERCDLLLSWLPNATPFVLPRATHLLHVEDPRTMAETLAGFYAP